MSDNYNEARFLRNFENFLHALLIQDAAAVRRDLAAMQEELRETSRLPTEHETLELLSKYSLSHTVRTAMEENPSV